MSLMFANQPVTRDEVAEVKASIHDLATEMAFRQRLGQLQAYAT